MGQRGQRAYRMAGHTGCGSWAARKPRSPCVCACVRACVCVCSVLNESRCLLRPKTLWLSMRETHWRRQLGNLTQTFIREIILYPWLRSKPSAALEPQSGSRSCNCGDAPMALWKE